MVRITKISIPLDIPVLGYLWFITSSSNYVYVVMLLFGCTVNDLMPGNQLVSYTRQMDLACIGHQAKFENASLRTKHFRI